MSEHRGEPERYLQLLSSGQELLFADALALTRHLQRQGHQVLLAGALNRVQHEQVSIANARWASLTVPPYPEASHRRFFTPPPPAAVQLARLLQDFPPDVIHCHGVPALALATAALRRRGAIHRARLICSLADLSLYQPTRLLRRLLSGCEALITTAQTEQEALERLDPKLAESSRLIHSVAQIRGITSDFDLARKRRSVGVRSETAVVGVLSPARRGMGLETVIEAAEIITGDFPNVEFLFVGDGPDSEELMLLAHERRIGGAVIFRGDRADLPEIIASLNVLVIPREVPGAVARALQALALQIPVLADDTPALRQVLGAVDPDGFVPRDDPRALAQALARRLEILPPPEQADYGDIGINLSVGQMLVSTSGFDLDSVGLEAQWRGDESEMQQAVRKAEAHFSARAMVTKVAEVYREVDG